MVTRVVRTVEEYIEISCEEFRKFIRKELKQSDIPLEDIELTIQQTNPTGATGPKIRLGKNANLRVAILDGRQEQVAQAIKDAQRKIDRDEIRVELVDDPEED